jgi:hypothetical protein
MICVLPPGKLFEAGGQQTSGSRDMDGRARFTLIMTVGVFVSFAGIYYEVVDKSDMIGAGLFLLQGALFLLYYSLRTGKTRKK